MNLPSTGPRRLLAAAALMLYAALAHAQFAWIDEKGMRQYSDRPPPPSIPLKNILKAPGQPRGPMVAAAEAAARAAPAEPPKGVPNPKVAERNAEYLKQVKERAEKEKKADEERDAEAAKKENCGRLQEAKATLDSGVRIGVTEKNGERGIMDDAKRASETERVNSMLASCK